ncbi:hypothetical protein BDP55DRAFT_538006 [Colletotrichum godetiae]|uniref:Uncharacterized protein n=1 Tax=Colletotrichum godetiae TaxID=1209918 RepID=A0AAJ0EZ56_9PEZI|nr:uncharacterized protein BDP55DRAFT_538006 [Colletotrichum godetiae]KAK1700904.1 hypothetical protein BDP55DRAFT_538006 [Colletotrichum godetiae]
MHRHQSWFSYPISKPYPFRWFTPVVLVGGVILTVFLSLVNLSANGYYLKPLYTSDPNGTEAYSNAQWYRKPPFNWRSDVRAECQPRLLTIGDSFFTSNLGFRYIIKAISDSRTNSLSSLNYKNNTLESCSPKSIALKLKKSDTAVPPAASWWLSYGKSTMMATVDCTIVTDDGIVTITLVTEEASGGDHDYSYVIEDDYRTHASVWWGTRLLNAYWSGVMTVAANMTNIYGSKNYVVRSGLTYTPKPSEDIYTDKFFDLYWWLANADSSILNKNMDKSLKDYNSDWYGSPSLTEGLHSAKILFSLLSLDLGNCPAPNLLLDDRGLRYTILAPDDYNRDPGRILNGSKSQIYGSDRYNMIPAPGSNDTNSGLVKLRDSYDKFQPMMGPLGCKNATIVSQYLCSVPQQKNGGVMLFSILLADLLFLQAAWKILTWIADGLVSRGSTEAMTCQGCQARIDTYQSLQDFSSTRNGFGAVPKRTMDWSESRETILRQ